MSGCSPVKYNKISGSWLFTTCQVRLARIVNPFPSSKVLPKHGLLWTINSGELGLCGGIDKCSDKGNTLQIHLFTGGRICTVFAICSKPSNDIVPLKMGR